METARVIQHAVGSRFLKINSDYYELFGHNVDATLVMGILEGWLNFRVSEVLSGRQTIINKRVKASDLLVFRTYEQIMTDSFGIIASKNRVSAALRKLETMGFITIQRNPLDRFDRRNFFKINHKVINAMLSGLNLTVVEDVEWVDLDEYKTTDSPVQDDASPVQNSASPAQDVYKNNSIRTTEKEKNQQTNQEPVVVCGGSLISQDLIKEKSLMEKESEVSQTLERSKDEDELLTYSLSLDNSLIKDNAKKFAHTIAKFSRISITDKRLAVAFCVFTGHYEIIDSISWQDELSTWGLNGITVERIKAVVDYSKSDVNKEKRIPWNDCLRNPKSYSWRINNLIVEKARPKFDNVTFEANVVGCEE